MNIENIKKRETAKLVDIDDRTFRISKFDPLLGNYILLQLVQFILPFGLSEKIGVPDALTSNVNQSVMNKAQFLELQRDILSVCEEVLPAGETPVVREDGTYGIIGFTSTIAIRLLIASITFNFSDFFDVSGLTSTQDN